MRQGPEDLSVLEVLLGGGAQFGAPHQQQSIHNWHITTALFVIAACNQSHLKILHLHLINFKLSRNILIPHQESEQSMSC